MKKSEMVKKMTEHYLGLCYGEDPKNMGMDDGTFEIVLSKMDNLLDMMEYFGMLPPQYLKIEEGPIFIDNIKREDENWGFPASEWEPEND